jgi:threonine dehydrogenase-like Zn-dependent dehydrogenase
MAAEATTLAFWVESPGKGSLRHGVLRSAGVDEHVVASEFSGISVGTERLVGLGLVPETCATAMTCRGMQGSFALPVCYGYSLVGRIDAGPFAGRRVFTMHPHQDRVVVGNDHLISLPDQLASGPRATLLPNLETALNAVWDAELCGGERIAIVGGGAVGLLVAFVLHTRHGDGVVLVETDARRRQLAAALPWMGAVIAPDDVEHGRFDVVFHASASNAGLQLAIDAIGFEGRVIDLSWYGARSVMLQLGTSFHHQRKRLVASQVATIARSHRAAGRAARTMHVLGLLQDERLDALLGAPIPFAELPEFFARLCRGEVSEPCPVVAY